MTKFKEGDVVTYEMSADIPGHPRWNHEHHGAGNGEWEVATVTMVQPGCGPLDCFKTVSADDDSEWYWPKGDFPNREGWVQHITSAAADTVDTVDTTTPLLDLDVVKEFSALAQDVIDAHAALEVATQKFNAAVAATLEKS